MPSILFRPKPNVEKTPAAPKASPLCCGSLQPTNQSTNMSTALNNNSTRRRPDGSRMPKSKAIKGIDEDMKLNKALWEMAEYFETAEHNRKIHPTGERIKPSPELGLSGVTESNPELGITFRYSRRSHIWCKRFHFLDCDRDFGPLGLPGSSP